MTAPTCRGDARCAIPRPFTFKWFSSSGCDNAATDWVQAANVHTARVLDRAGRRRGLTAWTLPKPAEETDT